MSGGRQRYGEHSPGGALARADSLAPAARGRRRSEAWPVGEAEGLCSGAFLVLVLVRGKREQRGWACGARSFGFGAVASEVALLRRP